MGVKETGRERGKGRRVSFSRCTLECSRLGCQTTGQGKVGDKLVP